MYLCQYVTKHTNIMKEWSLNQIISKFYYIHTTKNVKYSFDSIKQVSTLNNHFIIHNWNNDP